MSRSTFSVLFYANKSKVKNGIVPVMGRITINGTQSQFSCKRSIPLSLWDAKGRSFVRLHSKNLIRYQDTYAEQMAAYGLKRGIKGSEAQHISTQEYYRSLIAQGEDLQANISHLLEEQEKERLVIAEAEQAKKDLARIKSAIKREQRHACMVVAECEQTRLKAKAGAKTEELKSSTLGRLPKQELCHEDSHQCT